MNPSVRNQQSGEILASTSSLVLVERRSFIKPGKNIVRESGMEVQKN